MFKTEDSVNEEYWEYNYDFTVMDLDVAEDVSELEADAIYTGIDVKCEKPSSSSAAAYVISSGDETDCDVQIVGAYTLGIGTGQANNEKNRSAKKKNKAKGKAKIEFTVKCRYCPTLFDCRAAMRYHVPRYHIRGVRKSLACYLCKKTLSQMRALKDHMKVKHTGQSLLICPFPVCAKAYPRQSYLETHINAKHTRKIVFKCRKCDKQFYYEGARNYHCKNKHRRGHICKWCKKSYATKDYLEKHVQRLHAGKPRIWLHGLDLIEFLIRE